MHTGVPSSNPMSWIAVDKSLVLHNSQFQTRGNDEWSICQRFLFLFLLDDMDMGLRGVERER